MLSVSLKDLASGPDGQSGNNPLALGDNEDDIDEAEQHGREQYRVIKKDLLFKVNF